ncbi:DNA repair protein RecN [Oceanobacillus piezotolerans]|uniref:DNA repair protein RecN n=1 Tax=Oceanobacillus piezotolerans TaxID=2448030 RepID=A0A498DAI4_9BACI|nr:DNA repair protein RecN [Oceanobacillus piezotolerans]RLL48124.1 DNA repair protein RecN [Oceanobacillus piezotolerans]
MLTELSIRDFAIIDEISVTFYEGLTVLTGETGAGKSIIIDAIQLLAGGRGSVDYVRHGTKKCEIEGLFILEDDNHDIYRIAEQFGVEIVDGQVVLERVITASGKSICRVNSKLVTLGILKEFGRTLIDIHSQHETQSLMDADHHIDFLDLYDPKLILKAKEEYLVLYNKLKALQKRYKQLNENEQENAQRLDLLQFQRNELEEANLSPNEDEQLELERQSLMNFERIYTSLNDTYNALYGESKGLEWVNKAHLALDESKRYDTFINEKAEEMAEHYFALEELTYDLRNHMDRLQYDPERLNEIEARLNEINRLKRKYGSTVNDLLTYQAKIEEEIEQITNKDTHLSSLQKQMEEVEKDVKLEADQLHDLRKKSAERLTKAVSKELKDLYLEKASFDIAFEKEEQNGKVQYNQNGYDHVSFLISTNPGEPLKELSKVASGGELSRIMLVLKKLFAKSQGVTSVIFDEVDTGVSGRVAQAIAEKIYQISVNSQVLCITHLPQVAAMADTHKFIQKQLKGKRTITSVKELTKEEQIVELSRMITGTKLTETAKEHAKELLDLAYSFKVKA